MIQLTITAATSQEFMRQLFGLVTDAQAAQAEGEAGGYPPPPEGGADAVGMDAATSADKSPEPQKPEPQKPRRRKHKPTAPPSVASPPVEDGDAPEPGDADYAAATGNTPTADEFMAAMRAFAKSPKGGLANARAILDSINAKRVEDVPDYQRAGLIAQMQEMMAS